MKTTVPLHLLIFLFSIVLCTAGSAEEVADKECATCHFPWMPQFIQTGKGTQIAPLPKERAIDSEKMCFSCHDGSVVDSRDHIMNDRHHPIGKKPSSRVSIPAQYPLGKDGTIQCFTCHTAHLRKEKTGMAKSVFLRKDNANSEMCMDCHGNKSSGSRHGNHPTMLAIKDFPDTLTRSGAKLGKGNRVICQSCHAAHGSPNENFLVTRNENSQLCLTCHAEKGKRELIGGRIHFHPVDVLPVKAKIADAFIKAGGKTGEGGKLICNTCHSMHRGVPGTQLNVVKASKGDKGDVCLSCHDHPEYKDVARGKHHLKGGCSACHLTHAFARKPGPGKDLISKMCFSCHEKAPHDEAHSFSHYGHMNLRLSEKTPGNGELPLFDSRGLKDPHGEILCTTCHDPHQFGDKKKGTQPFLRLNVEKDSALCQSCHTFSD